MLYRYFCQYRLLTSAAFYDILEGMIDSEEGLLDTEETVRLLSAEGPLAKIFPKFEEREEQKHLTQNICNCFNEEKIGVFEAATGVGKSLAYLLPALEWAMKNKTRVLISTATINLQQQLIEKDAPLALKILNKTDEFRNKVVLVKGRKNFICLRKFYQYADKNELFSGDDQTVAELKKIIGNEKFSGSREDIDFPVSTSVWNEVCSESDNCLAGHCPFFDICYVMRMKKKAEAAGILIANHYLLFNDLLAKFESGNFDAAAVLPSFKHVILDEAHAVEEAARSGFSESVNFYFVKKQMNALYRSAGKGSFSGKPSGVLVDIINLSERADLFTDTVKALIETLDGYEQLQNVALSLIPNETTWSFLQAAPPDIHTLVSALEKFNAQIFTLNKYLSTIVQNIPEQNAEDQDEAEESVVHDYNVILVRLQKMQSLFEQFENYSEHSEYIFWFEKNKTHTGEFFIEFYKTPLDLTGFMQSALFKPMHTVICTSATLQVSNSFDFALKKFGLQNFTEKEICVNAFSSPFPYDTNVLLNIPTDAPLPNDPEFNDFARHGIARLIQAGNGRALVLFTSYALLKQVNEEIQQNGIAPFEVFYQGQYERSRLLNLFKENVSSCLLATESFWTGVDIPGESLSHVILVKLPFEVPNHPVVFAKSQFIEQHGGKPFFELSIPQAVIKFKQGFGRLMRSKTDRGVITVLDCRLLKKSYGSVFLQSIPSVKRTFAPFENIIHSTKEFLG